MKASRLCSFVVGLLGALGVFSSAPLAKDTLLAAERVREKHQGVGRELYYIRREDPHRCWSWAIAVGCIAGHGLSLWWQLG